MAFDNINRPFTENVDELFGRCGPDSLDEARTEVLFNAVDSRGDEFVPFFDLELLSIATVGHPLALDEEGHANIYLWHVNEDGTVSL